MNVKFLGAALLAVSILAACGGGSGGGLTLPGVGGGGGTHSASYSSKLVFLGTLAGAQTENGSRREIRPLTSVHVADDGGVPPPIMVVSPLFTGMDTSVYGGLVEAQVSPAPTSSPTVAFTQTNADAQMQSPSPGPTTLPAGVVAEASIQGANVVEAQSAGTATAVIGSPINESPTTPVYSYMSVALDCDQNSADGGIAAGSNTPYTHHYGWKWSGTAWQPDDNASDADIYVDGPSCGDVNASEDNVTIHVPGGDTRVSTDTDFSSITASQWADSETSFTIPDSITTNPDGSQNTVVIGKTRNGSVTFKLFPNAIGQGPSGGYFGAIEVSGDSIDGF